MIEQLKKLEVSKFARELDTFVSRLFNALVIPLIGLTLGMLYIAPLCFWTDSEIWAVSSAGKLFTDPQSFAFEMKPIFYMTLALLNSFAHFLNIYFMYVARCFFAINAICILLLTYFLTKRLTGRKLFGFFALGLLATSVEFVQQVYRVRSDFLATSAILTLLFLLVKNHGSPNSSSHLGDVKGERLKIVGNQLRGTLLIIVMALDAAAITPNAAVLLSAFLPFWWIFLLRDYRGILRGERLPRKIKTTIAAVLVALLLVASQWLDGLTNSFHYFVETFGSESTGWPYWSLVRFEHLIWFAYKDIPLFAAILLSVILTLSTKIERNQLTNRFMYSGVLLALLLFFHPVKLPFMIGSFLPFFAIFIAIAMSEALNRWEQKRPYCFRIFIKFVCICLFVSQGRLALIAELNILEAHNSDEQIRVIRYLNQYLKQFKDPSYYDVIGILPDFPPSSAFVGPGQIEANRNAAETLKNSKIDFVFYVQKLTLIEDLIASTLQENYLFVGKGVFVRAIQLKRYDLVSDSKDSLGSQHFLELVRARFNLPTNDILRLCLRAETAHGQEITSNLTFKDESGTISRLRRSPDQLFTNKGLIFLPSNFSRIKVSPFGCPQIPTETSIQNLFRFDPEL